MNVEQRSVSFGGTSSVSLVFPTDLQGNSVRPVPSN
jgi:hypothetical protein